jgi:hypothetical protein
MSKRFKIDIVHGVKSRQNQYRHVQLKDIVGKTVEAIGATRVEGPYGDEPCTMLFFDDGTRYGFVHPQDE